MDNAPLLRVSRPVSACSRCRAAKVKCDGKLPACSACERAGKAHECTGGADQFARGKERSYMASLESKIEKLEKRLAALDGKRATTPANVGSTPTPISSPMVGRRRRTKKDEDGEIEELVADLGYMAINATTRDFYGFANDVSFGRIALWSSSVSKALESRPRAKLPARHTATQLIDHYFDKIFTTLPCLNESSFFGAVESVYRNETTASQFDIFCVYMVLAVGTMSLSRSRDSKAAYNASCFVKTALEYIDTVITPSAITGVQATLLLVQYSMLEPAHLNSWYLIGTASRIMIDIGLHQEPLKVSKKKSAEMDLRRRIFYCVYTLDRSISMVLQRPFTFSDDSVHVELPRVEDSTVSQQLSQRGTLTPMAAAVHLFKLRRLQSSWYQTLHLCGNEPLEDPCPYFHRHTDLLKTWLDEMPSTISAFTRDWLLLEWHYLNIYVAAPCPKIPRPNDDAMSQIFTNCASYAIRFRAILSSPENLRFVYTYHDALRTYFVGTNLLHALYRSEHLLLPPESASIDDLNHASNAIDSVIYVLSAMIVRWPDSGVLRDKFRTEAAYILAKLNRRKDALAPPPPPPAIQHSHPPPSPLDLSLAQQYQPMGYTGWSPAHPHQHGMLAAPSPGGPFSMSAHVATADFGNVAFYRYS